MKKTIFAFCFLLIVHSTLKTDDCFCQWVQTNGPASQNITSLVYSGGYVYASTPVGVFRTSNNGDNWVSAGLNNNIWSLTTLNNYIFAATSAGIFRTSNNGANWTLTNFTCNPCQTTTVSGNILFVGTGYSGICKTTDYGDTWDTVNSGLASRDITALGSYNGVIYTGTWNEWWVYRSTNNGINWVNLGLEGHILAFAFQENNVMVGRCDSIFRTSNNGLNWHYVSAGLTMFCENTQLYQAGSNIFVSSCGKLFMTSNTGTNWYLKNQGMENQYIRSFVAANDKVFAGTISSGVWRRNLSEIIGIKNVSTEVPEGFSLYQNYPNPFNPVTKIRFDIPDPLSFPNAPIGNPVILKVYDILGKEIQTLVNEKLQPGTYEVTFNGEGLTSGIYFYQLKTEKFSETKKLILLK